MHFGTHITIDGYGGSESRLDDEKLVRSCLDELTQLLGMHQLAPPQVYFADGNGLKDPGGWTGFVVVTESHISMHTFPFRRFLSADVYTCKGEMDLNFIEKYFREKFILADIESNYIVRGLKYPLKNVA